jgi:hypothetical protein
MFYWCFTNSRHFKPKVKLAGGLKLYANAHYQFLIAKRSMIKLTHYFLFNQNNYFLINIFLKITHIPLP